MTAFVDPEPGTRYGRLVLVQRMGDIGKKRWRVRCDCGVEKEVLESNLKNGHTQSCGCLQRERVRESSTTHGDAGTERSPEYLAWRSLISRCVTKDSKHYKWYGAKGVTLAAEWVESFEVFLAAVGRRPSPDHQISRRDPTLGFTPENTYWATAHEAGRTRTDNVFHEVDGERKCLEDWAAAAGINKSTLHYRLSKGLTMREALALGHGRRGKRVAAPSV